MTDLYIRPTNYLQIKFSWFYNNASSTSYSLSRCTNWLSGCSQVVSQQESEYLKYPLEELCCCHHCHDAADVAPGVKDVHNVRYDG